MHARMILIVVTLAAMPAWGADALAIDAARRMAAIQERISDSDAELSAMADYAELLRQTLDKAGASEAVAAPAVETLQQKLRHIIPAPRFRRVRAAEVFASVARVAKVDVWVDWESLGRFGISADTLISCEQPAGRMTVKEAVELIGCGVGFGDGVLFLPRGEGLRVVSSRDREKLVKTRTYDVTAIEGYGRNASSLRQTITDSVAPDTWIDNGGTIGALRLENNVLTVSQTAENLDAIEGILDELRSEYSLPAARRKAAQLRTQIAERQAEIDRLLARCRAAGFTPPARADLKMSDVLPDLNFDQTPFAQCIAAIGNAAGVMMHVRWDSLADQGVSRLTPLTLHLRGATLRAALDAALTKAGEGHEAPQYDLADGAIVIDSAENARKWVITRSYDLRDIYTAVGRRDFPERLMSRITETIAPDSWRDAGGTVGALRDLKGFLIVTQSRDNQRQVAHFVAKLRRELLDR